jgi:hypothetical protein
MKIDIKNLHKNFLNKKPRHGQTTDLVVCILQSCEVEYGNYCLLSNSIIEKNLIITKIVELVSQVTNLNIYAIKNDRIELSNGSVIFLTFRKYVNLKNMYFDLNRISTSDTIRFFEICFQYFMVTQVKDKNIYFDSII